MQYRSRLVVSILLLSFFLSGSPGIPQTSPEARNRYKVGRGYFERGKWKEAIEAFKQAIQIEADYADAHYLLGLSYLAEGNLDGAEAELLKVLQLNIKFVPAHLYLADVYLAKGNFAKARDEVWEAIMRDSRNPQGYYARGYLDYVEGKIQEAVDSWKKALEVDRKFAPAWHSLGVVFFKQKLNDEALFHLREAVRLKPDNRLYLFSLWNTLHTLGKSAEADEILKKIAPDSAERRTADAYLSIEKEDFQSAEKALREAIEKDPKFARAHLLLGRCLEKAEMWDEAGKCYEEALRIDPQEEEAIEGKKRVNEKKVKIDTRDQEKK